MIMPKKHFGDDDSIMLLLFTPTEFISIGGHDVMREFKEKFIQELENNDYELENFQLRYKPRYKDILIYIKPFVEEEVELSKEMINFFQTLKNKYLMDFGTGEIEPIKRILPIPLEEQPTYQK